ncbi:MAG: polysaccharide deacetylase [Paenibacillus sp.]|nr:polysaccharide deacetylase [Paenibacillus sp.]
MKCCKKWMITIGTISIAACLTIACSISYKPVGGTIMPSNTPKNIIVSPELPAVSPPASEPKTPTPSPLPSIKYRLNKNYDVVPIDPNENDKVVLLTFDDGPKDLKLNQQLLAALEKHHAKAIFFVNGFRVKQKPELLKLIHSKGQVIGNHSWDHIDLKLEKPEKIAKQIKDVQVIVKETIGEAPRFFRPPFGSGGEEVKKQAAEQQLLYMTWSIGSEDWLEKYQSSEAVIKRVLEQLHYGGNILMHELPWTAEALDDLLTQLEQKGYSFVDPLSIQVE